MADDRCAASRPRRGAEPARRCCRRSAAFLLIQLQILLDCSDGEVARWRNSRSPAGIYLDRIGHYVTEAALPIALGDPRRRRLDRSALDHARLVIAVLVLLIKGETALVHVARAEAGLPPAGGHARRSRRRGAALPARAAPGARRALPFYRAFVAIEFTLLALAAAIVGRVDGDLDGTRRC